MSRSLGFDVLLQAQQSAKQKKKKGVVESSVVGGVGGVGVVPGLISPEEEAAQIMEIVKHFNPQPLVYQDQGWNSLDLYCKVQSVETCASVFSQF